MARDTSKDWEKIGAEEPWYGVLSAPEFLRQNLTNETIDKFYAQGASEIDEVVAIIKRHFDNFAPKYGVDFGSGLGRLAISMAKICDHVWGVDVAPSMCTEARHQASRLNISNISFGDKLPEGVTPDWINSYIVIQHILPRIGYALISSLVEKLNLGGFISIQITFAHDERDTTTLVRDISSWRFDGETLTVIEEKNYDVGQMSMYDYDLNRVFMILLRCGIRDFVLRHTDHGGVHGFWIFGRKTC